MYRGRHGLLSRPGIPAVLKVAITVARCEIGRPRRPTNGGRPRPARQTGGATYSARGPAGRRADVSSSSSSSAAATASDAAAAAAAAVAVLLPAPASLHLPTGKTRLEILKPALPEAKLLNRNYQASGVAEAAQAGRVGSNKEFRRCEWEGIHKSEGREGTWEGKQLD